MRKVITFMLAAALLLSGCGGSSKAEPTAEPTAAATETFTAAPTAKPTATPAPTPVPEPTVDVDERLFNVTIRVPADYVGGTTQEDLDAIREERGYKSVTLNDDGSATYVMNKRQHREILASTAEMIDQALIELAENPDYPGIKRIEAGDNYESFTVYLNTADVGFQEIFSAVVLYFYGGLYNSYLEDGADNIHVSFVNNAGTVVQEADSRDMQF